MATKELPKLLTADSPLSAWDSYDSEAGCGDLLWHAAILALCVPALIYYFYVVHEFVEQRALEDRVRRDLALSAALAVEVAKLEDQESAEKRPTRSVGSSTLEQRQTLSDAPLKPMSMASPPPQGLLMTISTDVTDEITTSGGDYEVPVFSPSADVSPANPPPPRPTAPKPAVRTSLEKVEDREETLEIRGEEKHSVPAKPTAEPKRVRIREPSASVSSNDDV